MCCSSTTVFVWSWIGRSLLFAVRPCQEYCYAAVYYYSRRYKPKERKKKWLSELSHSHWFSCSQQQSATIAFQFIEMYCNNESVSTKVFAFFFLASDSIFLVLLNYSIEILTKYRFLLSMITLPFPMLAMQQRKRRRNPIKETKEHNKNGYRQCPSPPKMWKSQVKSF